MKTATSPGARVAIYLRVSTERQEDEGSSLDTQEAAGRTFAIEHGGSVEDRHIYRETFSGTELWERPKLTELRQAVRQREVDAVVCYAIDRLSRDPVHLGVVLSEADHAGVIVQFVTEPLDDSPEGQLIRFVRGYAAKIEHMKIRERSIRGKRARVESGKIHGHSSELYGYRRDKDAGVRLIYESEAVIIRRIFQWAAEGLPVRSIVRRLNDEGVPAPSINKRTYRDGRTPRWGHGALYRILTDPAYKGETYAFRWIARPGKVVNGRYRSSPGFRPQEEWLKLPDGTTPAIISPEQWQAVQTRLTSNKGESTRNATRPYLLRGVVYCATCGKKMRSDPEHGKRMYRCSSRETPAGHCGGGRVPADKVEAWVWDRITEILEDPAIITREVERRRSTGPDVRLIADRDAAERAINKVDRDLANLSRRLRSAADDDLMWDMLKREIAQAQIECRQLQKSLDEINARIAEQEAVVVRLDAVNAYCEKVRRNVQELTFEKRRWAVESLVEKVVANGSDDSTWHLEGAIPGTDAGISFQSY